MAEGPSRPIVNDEAVEIVEEDPDIPEIAVEVQTAAAAVTDDHNTSNFPHDRLSQDLFSSPGNTALPW